MTKFTILIVFLLVLAFLYWAFLPQRHVPYFRVASLRFRLRLRLHPGRGFASLAELWWYWGRFASFRESARCRPALPLVQRIVRPSAHSVYLGRAQYRHRLFQTIQENILIVGRSRSGKSGWLAKVLLRFGGAVVSATTKPDLFLRTSGLRARRGRRVDVFDPQRIGGPRTRSTVRFDPIPGCEDPSVAMRRGMAFTDAVRTQGTEADNFWSEQAAVQMPALFCAAALGGLDLRAPYRWVISGDTRQAERILRAHGRRTWADSIAQMRGAADKTGATVRMVLVAALKFMEDPAIACCVLPTTGEGFDIAEFLRTQGSLYLMADPRTEVSPVAPVFACLVNEIHWTACQLAGSMRGERHDPPLLLQLDEVAKICPLPVPALLADSGGRGIMMIIACQGLAQIEERWGKPPTRTVLDTSNQLYVSGIQDPDTLTMVSDLCGTATWRERGGHDGKTADFPVATPGMIRRLPRRRALILRADRAPVITHLPMVWNDWAYRWARLRGRDVARLAPAAAAAAVPAAASPVLQPLAVPGLEPAGAASGQLARPAPDLAAARPGAGRQLPVGDTVTGAGPGPWEGIGGVLVQLAQMQQKLADLDADVTEHREVLEALAARAADDGDSNPGEGYIPVPPPRWWALNGDERAAAVGRLRSWVQTVFRPGYGQLAARLPACWERHEVCLYWLDLLSEMHTYLYQDTGRSYGILAAAAEWHSRHLPAAAACFDAEALKCDHLTEPASTGADPWAGTP